MKRIYSATIRLKNGKVLVAANYGLKAFAFDVPEGEYKPKPE